jgi:hypothetical protein
VSDEIQQERDYLVDRLIATQRHDGELVGRSSTAMLVAALTDSPVDGRPYDVWDLNRCERTYELAQLIRANRARTGSSKADRDDYLQRTITRARSTRQTRLDDLARSTA